MKEIKVKEAGLYCEDGKYYIDATYTCEDDATVKEVHFPKIHMPLEEFEGDVDYVWKAASSWYEPVRSCKRIKLGNVSFPLEECKGVTHTEKIVKEKTRDMTISEIEKKLGYKIRIVKE